MKFDSRAQESCYDKIRPWIEEIYGEFAVPREDLPAFDVYYGSGHTSVAVLPWGERDSVVTSVAWIARGIEVTPELVRFLLGENAGMRFGAFSVDERGAICFRHSIRGSSCGKPDLRASSWAVVTTADRYGEIAATLAAPG